MRFWIAAEILHGFTIKLNGQTAFNVIGTDVYGPMGRELIPFGQETAAKEFMIDHGGKAIFNFKQITLDQVMGLDQ